jgi:hypothetical protein
MAEAKLGVLVQDIRGKAGTVVFQMSEGGLIIRPRVMGTNPNTPAQRAVRAALTKAARDWSNFSPTTVATWNAYAHNLNLHNHVSGRSYHPHGINAYMHLACKFYQVNPSGTAPTTPPTTAFNGDTIQITATADTGTVTFTASAPNSADVTTEFLLQPLRNANRKPSKKGYRSKGFFAFSSGNLTHDIEVPAGYYAAGYRFVNSATGQATEPVYLDIQQVTLSISQGNSNKGKAESTSNGKTKKAA